MSFFCYFLLYDYGRGVIVGSAAAARLQRLALGLVSILIPAQSGGSWWAQYTAIPVGGMRARRRRMTRVCPWYATAPVAVIRQASPTSLVSSNMYAEQKCKLADDGDEGAVV